MLKKIWENFRFSDLFPPVLLKIMKLLLGRYNLKLLKMKTATPFIHQCLGSFSQFQEDLLIDLLLLSKNSGFYVDVGANDPDVNSNTKRFYMRGWSGINIEPNLIPFKKLCLDRTRDLNLNIGMAPERDHITFYSMSDNTISSFDKETAEKKSAIYKLPIRPVKIEVWPLRDVFDKYLNGRKIDFMSVDAEGFDFQVLKSNDWERYRPTLLIVEINNEYQGIVSFLEEKKYMLVFNNYYNGVFIDCYTSDNHIRELLDKPTKI